MDEQALSFSAADENVGEKIKTKLKDSQRKTEGCGETSY